MSWKTILGLIMVVILFGLAGAGYLQWKEIQRQKALNDSLDRARGYITTLGEHAKGQAAFETILRENPNLKDVDVVLAMLAESYKVTKDFAKADRCWQKIYDEHPTSAHMPEALSSLAEELVRGGQNSKAVAYWDMILDKFPSSEYVDDAKFGKALLISGSGSRVAKREALWALLEEFPESNVIPDAEKVLAEINLDLLFSGQLVESEGDQIYTVKSGDTLSGIGKRFGASPDLLMRINHISNELVLNIGKRLMIPKLEFSIIVNKTDNTLLLLNRGKFFKRYRVRTGKDSWRTPTGIYPIRTKKKNPTWNKPGGRSYEPGDPENALGSRWMAFMNDSIGIHGCNDPSTIGTYASQGCVGMLNEEVEELYDLVPRGTEVKIIGKMVTND